MRSSPRPLGWLLCGLLVPLATGCGGQRIVRDENVPPFVFRSLNLRQQDRQGRPRWQLTSPEARYDIERRVAQATQPRGVIFAKGSPAYQLSATSGTVLNDGEVILLEGAIRVRRLGEHPVLISASRVRWYPGRALMEIDRRPVALDRLSRLRARRARFRFDDGVLELRGEPLLERWKRPFDPFAAKPEGDPEIVLRVNQADWKPASGGLVAKGPVRARRRPPGRKRSEPAQTLRASALSGNTQEQKFLLKAPVRFDDPLEGIELDARDVRIDAGREILRSGQPFRGRRRDLLVAGDAVEVDGGRDTVSINGACALDRPGESLRSERCVWNWTTQAVEAEGAVELRRRANEQITRGQRLQGRLGEAGELEVTSPGGRVFSRFRLPARSGPPPPPRRRQEPEPIRL